MFLFNNTGLLLPVPEITRTVFIKTYGCQMNVYDSDRMADVLGVHGYESVRRAEEADVVILNTCHIREKAAEKVYSELGRLSRLKEAKRRDGRRMAIGVSGCVAQAEGHEIVRRAPVVDMVFGPQTYHRLGQLLDKVWLSDDGCGAGFVDTSFPEESKFNYLPRRGTASGRGGAGEGRLALPRRSSTFLTIQEGCNKFCSFCVVPYTRGAEESRAVTPILEEAMALLETGVCEITLLGQNVNAWRGAGPDGEKWGLGRLIQCMAQLPELKRLRYTTSHPQDMNASLIEAHRDVPQLMPYLHLPVQSGSDKVLAAMNRRHSADDYRRVVDDIRRVRPDMALSSDFIVGFPGETAADFEETLKLVSDIGYAQAYSFRYSPRPGTPAAQRDDQVPEAEKAERLARLQELLSIQKRAFNQSCLGMTISVLFDRNGKHTNQIAGRSPWLQTVHVTASDTLVGSIAEVIIEEAYENSLRGRLTSSDHVGGCRPAP
ncbi:MAG: tRNA (N6-isopentenyl adenosine(37)-C2)-methylthiotransferase MiaB [Parvularculales bacterium]